MRHLIGLLLGTEQDWSTSYERLADRVGSFGWRGEQHELAVERVTNEPFDLRYRPSYELVIDRLVTVRLDPPLDDRAREVALSHVQRLREHVAPYADPADVDALDALADPDDPASVGRRTDAFLYASRRRLVSRAAS